MAHCTRRRYNGTLETERGMKRRLKPPTRTDRQDGSGNPLAMAHTQHRPRSCARCGTRLAWDNTGRLCAACRTKARDDLVKPPTLPRAFWLHDHLRDALESWHFGRLIAAYRSHPHHGRILTQQTVAGWLNLTQAQLSRIESGHAPEELGKLTYWAVTLGVPSDLLWFKLPAQKGQRSASDQGASIPIATLSPEAADAPATTAPTTTREPYGDEVAKRVSHALRHPGSVDFVTVAYLRRAVQELDGQYLCLPSTCLLADTGRYLSWISFLSPQATNGRVRRELHAVEAEAAVLMGQLVWDASQRRDHNGARRYYDQAIEASRHARDPLIEGLALLRKSMVALYGDKKPRDGLTLALQAADMTTSVRACF
jgi:transcriptional regulator with XRE-family HTH domain